MATDWEDEAAIRQAEERLLQADVRSSAEAVAQLLAENFVEIGSSGRMLDRQAVIAALQQEAPAQHVAANLAVSKLTQDVALVTYRARTREPEGQLRESLRSSIWQRKDGRWQMVFHQGTPSEPVSPP